jgi:hypothetical protein
MTAVALRRAAMEAELAAVRPPLDAHRRALPHGGMHFY